MTTITKKTTLLAAVPIAQTSDGLVKITSIKDGGQKAAFTWGHEWTANGSGFVMNPGVGDWAIANAETSLDGSIGGGEAVDVQVLSGNELKITKKASSGPLTPGTYPDAVVLLQMTRDGMTEYLGLPICLIVE